MGKRNSGGHYCWCCDQHRPNERFSGGGHRRHICRDCQKLPGEEREYRQAVRNIDSMVHIGPNRMSIRRKQRKSFEKYFEHANSRVREYAQQVAEQVEESRARIRSDEYQPPVSTPDDDVEPWVWDPVYEEAVPWTETYFPMTAPPPDPDRSTAERRLAFDDDDDIPF